MSYAIRQPAGSVLNPVVHFFIDGDEEDEGKLVSWRTLAAGDLGLGYETVVHTHEEKRPMHTKVCNADCEAYVLVWREEFASIVQVLREKK